MSRTQILRCDDKRAKIVHAYAKKNSLGIYEATEALIDLAANALAKPPAVIAPVLPKAPDEHTSLVRSVMTKRNLDEADAVAWLLGYAKGRLDALAKDAEKRKSASKAKRSASK